MADVVSVRERHNSYGVLCTVLGLLIAVVFAGEANDDWDAIVSSLGFVFATSFVLRVRDADLMELSLASFLAGVSLVTFVSAAMSWAAFGESDLALWLDERLLLVAVLLAVGLFLARVFINRDAR